MNHVMTDRHRCKASTVLINLIHLYCVQRKQIQFYHCCLLVCVSFMFLDLFLFSWDSFMAYIYISVHFFKYLTYMDIFRLEIPSGKLFSVAELYTII